MFDDSVEDASVSLACAYTILTAGVADRGGAFGFDSVVEGGSVGMYNNGYFGVGESRVEHILSKAALIEKFRQLLSVCWKHKSRLYFDDVIFSPKVLNFLDESPFFDFEQAQEIFEPVSETWSVLLLGVGELVHVTSVEAFPDEVLG